MTNNTADPIKKYAALVSYNPQIEKYADGSSGFQGQIHAIDIDLAAGASVEQPIVSCFYGISRMNLLWIDFDSLAERDSFLDDSIFGAISTNDIQGYRTIDSDTGAAWMKNTLGITINPAR